MIFDGIYLINMLLIISLPIAIVFVFKTRLNIILLSEVDNNNVILKLNIKYMFGLINVDKQLYPREKKSKQQNNKKWEGVRRYIHSDDIYSIYRMVKSVEIEEVYSNIECASENIKFTCVIYLFVNTIYGNLINIIQPRKIYLKVNPNFTGTCIKGKMKIHIKLKIKDIVQIAKIAYKVYKRRNQKHKEEVKNESTGVNKKSYGDNS